MPAETLAPMFWRRVEVSDGLEAHGLVEADVDCVPGHSSDGAGAIRSNTARASRAPTRPLSPGRVTWPGEKRVYRFRSPQGVFQRDVLALRDEPFADAEALLRTVMTGGRTVEASPALRAVQAYCGRQVRALPEGVRRLHNADRYPVVASDGLRALRHSLEARLELTEIATAPLTR